MKLEDTCPKEVEALLARDLVDKDLEVWASSTKEREHLQPRPWLQPVAELLGSKAKKEEWGTHQKNALRTLVVGGYPSQVDLYSEGKVDSELCPMCKQHRGTRMHCFWKMRGRTGRPFERGDL